MPMVRVLLVTRLLARALGTYPRVLAASKMRSLVCAETDPLPLSTLLAVWKLTPAFEATSRKDTCVRGRLPFSLALQAGVGDALDYLALEEQEDDYEG
jgi:hypothetical protein